MKLVRENIEFKRGQDSKKSLNIGDYKIWESPIDWNNVPPGNYKSTNHLANYSESCLIKVSKINDETFITPISWWTSHDPFKKLIKVQDKVMKTWKEINDYAADISIQKTDEHPELFESLEFKRGQNSKKGLGVGKYRTREAPFDWNNIPDGNYIATDTVDNPNYFQHCLIKIRTGVGEKLIRQITYWVETKYNPNKNPIPNKIARFAEDWYEDNDFNLLQKTDDYSKLFESIGFRRVRDTKRGMGIGIKEINKDWWIMTQKIKQEFDLKFIRVWSKRHIYASKENIAWTDEEVKDIEDWINHNTYFRVKNIKIYDYNIHPETNNKNWTINIQVVDTRIKKGKKIRESIEFKRGISSKDAIGVGMKETNRDLETLAQNFKDHFSDKYTFLDHIISRRDKGLTKYGTGKYPIFFMVKIDSMQRSEFELDRKRRRFKSWVKKNTHYIIKSEKRGHAFINKKSPSGYQISYTFYLDDK